MEILNDREKTHGRYDRVSAKFCKIIGALEHGGVNFTPAQFTALAMIAMKMARIMEGDPNHADHWVDIAGYATLVAREIESAQAQEGAK